MFGWNHSFILFLIYFANCAYVRASPSHRDSGNTNEFEVLKLALNWSPTVCQDFRRAISASSGAACSPCLSRKAVNKWTIHGLWPSGRYSQGPLECSNIKYDARSLDSLMSQLHVKWPSLINNADDSFWSHEWKKHGTCYGNSNAINSEVNYFSTALQLYDNYNVQQILESANVVPGYTYDVDYLSKVFKGKLGVDVYVQCIRSESEQYLSQIELCFDKSLQLINCDGNISNCNRRTKVTYNKSC